MEIRPSPTNTDRIVLRQLPAFAQFILRNHFNDFIREQIRLSRQYKIQIHQSEFMTDDDMIADVAVINKEFLEKLSSNKISEQIEDDSAKWRSKILPVELRNKTIIDDIFFTSHVSKKAFLPFVASYSSDANVIVELFAELDEYFMRSRSSTIKNIFNDLEDKVNEHSHFIEKINDTSPGIVYVFDLVNQKFIYVNRRPIDMYGYAREDFHELNNGLLAEVIHKDDIGNIFKVIQDFKTVKKEVRSFECRLKDKAGKYHWVRNYVSAFRFSPTGKPIEAIGIAINVEKEKQASAQLLKSEDQLLEAQTLADMGSFLLNLKTLKCEMTPQAEKILSINNRLFSEEFYNNIHPTDRKYLKDAVEKAIKEENSYDYEFRYTSGEFEKVIWSKGTVLRKENTLFMKGTVMDVTERHHIIQRLQRSDELYKQAQAITHIGSWSWDLTKDKLNWSDEMYRIYGLKPGTEIITKEIGKLNHPDDVEKVNQEMDNAIRNKQPHDFHYRIILPGGDIRMLHSRGESLSDENGKVYKLIGTLQDVTEQKKIEKQLHDNQNFIRKIADATPSIIGAYNIHSGKYLFINKAIEKILGYEPKEVLEKGVAFLIEMVHPDDLQPLMEKNSRALEIANKQFSIDNEPVIEFQYRMRHKDGRYRHLHTFGTIFDRDSKNEVEHILNISMDVTDRIDAEKKIEEQKLFIERIADASPTVLFLYDIPAKSILYANNEVFYVSGYAPEELLKMKEGVIDLFHPDDLSSVNRKNSHTGENEVFQYECRIRHKNNTWRWLLVNEIIFRRENGKPLQVLGAALDITSRKEMEKDLLQKTAQLQQSNANLEEFAYVASHDLKEPLRKISSFSDRLLNSQLQNLDENGRTYLEKIIMSSKRMQLMVDDLLALSKISADKTYSQCNLSEILDEVLRTLEVKIEEKNATINAQKLPEANVVPSQISHLLQNLLSNSLKFTREGIQPEINITCDKVEGNELPALGGQSSLPYYKISISDNGIGFDSQFSEKIFSIFQRLHGRSEYEGTGIGLAICRKIVENHEGIIVAESNVGDGATFTFYLPI